MIRLSKSALAVGGVVLAGGLITVMNPKTVHAVAAALVEVTNTASNPVVTQGIGQQAAQIVEIGCGSIYPEIYSGCGFIPPDGLVGSGFGYTVPNGQTLVINAVDVYTGTSAGTPCTSSAVASLIIGNASDPTHPREIWLVPAGIGTAHYVYPSGIAIPAGMTLQGVQGYGSSSCILGAALHGYLTAQ
jgi:hypothetical protein